MLSMFPNSIFATGHPVRNDKALSSFKRHFWNNRFYRLLLLTWGIGALLQFVLFKQLYPFADFFGDSYFYIYSADANLNISLWPIGYSKFLRLFHFITDSDTALVAFQYFSTQLAALYLFLTLGYLYKISRRLLLVLFIFLTFNPLFLYACNYVNSDSIFLAISLVWFSQLIWIINRPSYPLLATHAIVLFLAFTIRNNAYYYPLITMMAFVISRNLKWVKVVGSTAGLLLIIPFILFTRNEAYKITGAKQFSLFTGWQLANNAMYMYRHINVDGNSLPTPQAKELNEISKSFFANPPADFDELLKGYSANFFIKDNQAPLRQYFFRHYRPKDKLGVIRNWGESNVVFADYGSYLIKNHPLAYLQHFGLLNAVNYFFPPLEKFEIYNLGIKHVDPIAQSWFNYTSTEVTAVSKDIQRWILLPFQVLFMFLNVFAIIGAFWLIGNKNRVPLSGMENKICWLMGSFLIVNFGFSVLATINVMRYQLFPLCICVVFCLMLFGKMEKGNRMEAMH